MAHADIERDDRITVWSEPREKDLIRQAPGARYDATARVWTVPLSWSSCKVLRGVFGSQLTVGEALAKWAWDEVNSRIEPCMRLRESLEEESIADDRLYPFQRAGVAFLSQAERALLADEMGTGKTIQTICALQELTRRGHEVFPALVIAPNSMKLTWKAEFKKWWPSAQVEVITGGAVKRRKALDADADVYIINWESVRLHSRLAPYGSIHLKDEEKEPKELNRIDFRTVVADEAHRMKDPGAKQTRAVWAVAHQDEVRYRFALTGTPLANAPDDLWSLLHFIDPTEWPAKTKYVERYCHISWNAFGGMDVIGVRPEMKDEFFSILDPRMRRMPKELVLPFLPKKIHQRRYIELPAKQRKAYDQMEASMIAQLEEGTLLATNPLVQLTRLVQFSSAYVELHTDPDRNETRAVMTDPSGKIDEMMAILDELDPSESVVVAAESRQLIELAAKRLDEKQRERVGQRKSPTPWTYRLITGGLTEDMRERAKEDFQEGRCRLLLFTMKAGGVGLTLTRAGVAIFLQRSWSMLDNKQAEDRIHRIGSEIHDKVVIIDLIAQGTVEERQLDMLAEKDERLQEIVRDQTLIRNLLVRD